MTDFRKIILALLPLYVGLVVLAIFAFRSCGSEQSTKTIIKKDSSIVYMKDTSRHSHSTTNIFPVQTITVVPPTLNIDTPGIIAAFYNKNVYKQTIGDSMISINTVDCLQCNSIDYSNITWQFKKPYQVTKTYTTTETKEVFKGNGFYIGAYAELNKQLFGIGPQANFVYKNNNFGIGFNAFNRSALIQYSHKIGK